MVNTYTLPLPSAPTTTPFQADDEGSIPFTRSTGFPLKTGHILIIWPMRAVLDQDGMG